jgi:hypothetical protein
MGVGAELLDLRPELLGLHLHISGGFVDHHADVMAFGDPLTRGVALCPKGIVMV